MAATAKGRDNLTREKPPRAPSLTGFRLRLLALGALLLLPLYVLLITGVYNEYAMARDEVQGNGLRLVRLVALHQERSVAAIRPLLEALSRLPDVAAGTPECNAILGQFVRDNPAIGDVGVAGPDGAIRCAGSPDARGTTASGKAWFARSLAGKGFAAGDYEVVGSKRIIGFGYPFNAADGTVAGVVYATQNLETLNDVAMRVDLPPESVLTVIDRGGTILARYPDPQHWVGRSVPDAPLVAALRAERLTEGVFEAPGLTGTPRIFAFTPLDETTASSPFVTIGYAKDVLLADANRNFALNLLGLASLTLVVLLLAWTAGDYLIIDHIRALQEVDLLKSEFVSIASHQLRTPLTSLRWMNELLALKTVGELTADQEELVRQSAKTLAELRELVDDLLRASVLDAGTSLHPSPTDLAAAAHEVVSEFAPLIEKKGLDLVTSYGDPMMVEADPLFLRQVIANLLENAVRYTPKGGEVTISVEHGGGGARFSVSDSGIGIPEGDRSRIFERFFRASNVRLRFPSGTGLGLFLAKTVVERSGGRIGFTSRENAGSTFWFVLPLMKDRPARTRGGKRV